MMANVPAERVGIVMINFGEPEDPTAANVESYLERIFLQNASLEDGAADPKARARDLAKRRAPDLLREYRDIGGSPLNAQADAQAEGLQATLRGAGWDVNVYSAFQFTAPSISEMVTRARADEVATLVALPVFPLCGHSTSVSAVNGVREAMVQMAWNPRFTGITGWHFSPEYVRLWADQIEDLLTRQHLDLNDPDTLLYFSAHGTPTKYLQAGNRYDRYVAEHCQEVSRMLRAEQYAVGFQNHSARGIPWTQPDNEDEIRRMDATRLVVVPISFMHEQSETLVELDIDLRRFAEGLGKSFHRVPVPHDDPRFTRFLAQLVGQLVGTNSGAPRGLARCRCNSAPGVWCTNGDRDLPPSPYFVS
jgi:ferrochelatase